MMNRSKPRYHHLGMPNSKEREGEVFLEDFGMYVTDHHDNPYGIQWMRFEPGSHLPDLVKTIPHLAFQVEDLDEAIRGREVLIPPNCPSSGVRVAFIVHDGLPVEFLEFDPGHPDRLSVEEE